MAEEKPEELSADEIAAELRDAGIVPTRQNLQEIIAAALAKDQPRPVEVFPLKAMLPLHVSYETGRRAAARGELVAVKVGGDWFVTRDAVSDWLASSGHWFTDEGAVQRWRASIVSLDRWWNA